MSKRAILKNMSQEDIKTLECILCGITRKEWEHIKISIDVYFARKADDIKIDDLEKLEKYLIG